MIDNDEEMFIWEVPIIEKPEFRLYFDDLGSVVCYTCEKLEGNYIIIDALAFAEGRYDVRVVEGRVIKDALNATIIRLIPSTEGTLCAAEDLSVIVNEDDDIEKQYWKLAVYEL
jgi:dynactin complex subunit